MKDNAHRALQLVAHTAAFGTAFCAMSSCLVAGDGRPLDGSTDQSTTATTGCKRGASPTIHFASAVSNPLDTRGGSFGHAPCQ